MSKIFYDQFIDLGDLKSKIDRISQSGEEKEELWHLVDEYVHHRILGCIFDNLPRKYHDEFMKRFYDEPFNDGLIEFLNAKMGMNFEKVVREEVDRIKKELLKEACFKPMKRK